MKKIIVIGASSGLGERIATDFARLGWRVGIAARREDRLRAIKDKFPDRVEYSVIDVTAPDAVRRFYDLIELIDGMDVLLYAAGCGFYDPELDPTETDRTLAVNVQGFTHIVTAAYKYFKQTANVAQGQIACITSVGGLKGLANSAAYSASKRYQWTYLQALDQLTYRQQVNVRITDIRPGFIRTDLLESFPAALPLEMSVDYAAPRIEAAILRRRRLAYIDTRWAVVSALWSLVPRPLWRHLSFDF